MTKRGYISPSKDYLHSHALTLLLSFPLPLGNLPLSWTPSPDTPHATPAISPRFLGSQDRVPIELLFLLKIIKSDSGPDPGALTGFPSRGCVHPKPFYPFPYLHCNLSLAFSFFSSAGPRSRSRPGPSLHRASSCLLFPSHDVLTCYASASPRAYAYRSASDRSEAVEHYRGRNSNPVAEQA